MEKKTRSQLAKLGGFNITLVERDGDLSTLEISTTDGAWTVCYREDNSMFGAIQFLLTQESAGAAGVEMCVLLNYITSNVLPDMEMMEAVINAVSERQTRLADDLPKPTDEEDKQALKDVVLADRLKQDIGEE